MKRFLTLTAILVCLAASLSAQSIGSGFIDQNKAFVPGFLSGLALPSVGSPVKGFELPTSLMGWISSGIFKDEIDILIRAPYLLKDYKGYTIYSAYGNYEFYNNALNAASAQDTAVNPFLTNALLQGTDNLGNINVGLIMPLGTMRVGILAGEQNQHTTAINSNSTASSTVDTVGPTFGVAEYSTTTSNALLNESSTGYRRYAAGANLGFMGVSAYFITQGSSQNVGGVYDHSWTVGTDAGYTVPANQVTKQQNYFGQGAFGYDAAGTGANGNATAVNLANESVFGVVGQLPLTIMGISMPLTAQVKLNGITEVSDNPASGLAARYNNTTAYVNTNGADGSVGKVSTSSVLRGENTLNTTLFTTGYNASVLSTPGDAPALATDFGASGTDGFMGTVEGVLEPVFTIDPTFTVKPRLGAGFAMGIANTVTVRKSYSNLSRANIGATNDVWSYSNLNNNYANVLLNKNNLDLGSMFEFSNADKSFTAGFGLFVNPVAQFYFTGNKTSTELKKSWTDAVNANEMTAVNYALGTRIGDAGSNEGTSVETTENGYDEFDFTLQCEYSIPFAVKASFFDKKLTTVFGYSVKATTQAIYSATTTDTSRNKSNTLVKDTAGTTIYEYTNQPAANINKTVNTDGEWTTSDPQWFGQMGFMVRWQAMENVTLDFKGDSLLNNLNTNLGDLFSLNNGLVQFTQWVPFIQNLELSATIHF